MGDLAVITPATVGCKLLSIVWREVSQLEAPLSWARFIDHWSEVERGTLQLP